MPRLPAGAIRVGDANGHALEVVPTGDVGVSTAGVFTIQPTKLARSTQSYIVSDVGVKDLLVSAAATRTVLITVTVTTAFANGSGAQPTLTIGEEGGSATKFAPAARFTSAAALASFTVMGVLTTGTKLQATLVAGTGTSTGAYTIDVVAIG